MKWNRCVFCLAAVAPMLLLVGHAAAGRPKPAAPPKLTGAVTASGSVSLRAASGKVVQQLRAGWYTVTIADDARSGAFHLVGPGVDKSTGAHFRGVAIWGVHFRVGVYRYQSGMRGTATRVVHVR